MNPNTTISRLIEHFGGTQKACAEALGVSQPTVNAWVNGRHGISGKHAIRIERITSGSFKVSDLCIDDLQADQE